MFWFGYWDLRVRAGEAWYEWGRDRDGDVRDLACSPGRVIGTVDSFVARLTSRDGQLAGDCSCDWARLGNFCEHCVAVGAAALARAPKDDSQSAAGPPEPVDVHAYLASADQATLAQLLTRLVDVDPALRQLLSSRAAGGGAWNAGDLEKWASALRQLPHTEVDDGQVRTHAVDRILHALRVAAIDHPTLVRPLYQQVMRELSAHGDDDSEVPAYVRSDVVARVAKALVEVCRDAPPDPVEFAQWLFDLQVSADADVSVTDFVDVLGDAGLARYQELLEEPPVEQDEADERRETIFRLRETFLANITGDVDGLIELYTRAPRSVYRRHERIGQALRAAGRLDEAIRWLVFSRTDSSYGFADLSGLIAEIHTGTGRHKEAARARWAAFENNPGLATYEALLTAAGTLDAVDYAKDRAMTFLRTRAAARGKQADPLVTILAATGDVDQAWAVAHEFGCSEGVKFLVAQRRAPNHPQDAIPFYERKVANQIDRKTRSSYASAAATLKVLKFLHLRADTDFDTYLAQVKAKHSRKSAFMEALAEAGLSDHR